MGQVGAWGCIIGLLISLCWLLARILRNQQVFNENLEFFPFKKKYVPYLFLAKTWSEMIFQLILMSFKHFVECRFLLEPENINLKFEAFSVELQVLYLNYTWERSSLKHDSYNISLKRSFLGDNLTILVCLISKTHEIVAKKAIESVKI